MSRVITICPNYARRLLREMGIGPLHHLARHSTKDHPRGDEPGRCASGAITNRIRHLAAFDEGVER